MTAGVPLLVSDLGRPERFPYMLRMFKVTSPLSVGSWILAAMGPAAAGAAVSDRLGIFPRLGRAAEAVAGLLGPALATYTGTLVADTAVPVWHEAGRELPFVFAGSAAASAGAAAVLSTPAADAGPARRLVVAGAVLELGAAQAMERRLGELGEPYHQGPAGRLARLAKACTAAGAGLVALGGRRRRGVAAAGAALVLAGSACERWAVYKAGFQSARDPRYIVEPQRARMAERERERSSDKRAFAPNRKILEGSRDPPGERRFAASACDRYMIRPIPPELAGGGARIDQAARVPAAGQHP